LLGVMIVEEAVDGGLQIDHELEDATLETALGEVAKKTWTALRRLRSPSFF
jgi:hypothetical protein